MKISIVTAVYNSELTLRDTMQSVLEQSFGNWEHVVVDGGSTDNTLNIIREMEPLYGGRLRWVSEQDRGLYDAMNKGIALSSGDVVGILNSDDFYTSTDVLERVVLELSESNIDAVYGDIHYVDNKDLYQSVRYYSSRRFGRRWMLMGFQPAHPSFYCRREVYDRLGAFDVTFPVAADFECMFRMIYVNRIQMRYMPMDFVTMRRGGLTTSGMQSHLRIMRDHQRVYAKHGHWLGCFGDFLRYPLKLLLDC